jgi:hypothetical protein
MTSGLAAHGPSRDILLPTMLDAYFVFADHMLLTSDKNQKLPKILFQEKAIDG